MPRFHFNFSSPEESLVDSDGVELKDLKAAHAHALQIIDDMVAMFSDAEDWHGWRIDVTDADWSTVLIVMFPNSVTTQTVARHQSSSARRHHPTVRDNLAQFRGSGSSLGPEPNRYIGVEEVARMKLYTDRFGQIHVTEGDAPPDWRLIAGTPDQPQFGGRWRKRFGRADREPSKRDRTR